ncbi:MAG: ligase [Pseudomonadota bacterium]|jgi:hypothetical protein
MKVVEAATRTARVNKALNALCGVLSGVVADGELHVRERAALGAWLDEHDDVRLLAPFDELMPRVRQVVVDDGDVNATAELVADISWLAEHLRHHDVAMAIGHVDALQGLLGGIAMDGVLVDAEIALLRDWLEHHAHLATAWPFDEVYALLTAAGRDGRIDEDERASLLNYFSQFTRLSSHRAVDPLHLEVASSTVGVCSAQPEVRFASHEFCFTGAFARFERKQLQAVVERLGGRVSDRVGRTCNFVVVGGAGNPCWVHACYGRKVEQAVRLRREGIPVVLVHERDFMDALWDEGLDEAAILGGVGP